MAKVPEFLNQNEEVVLDLRPHWWFFVKPFGALIGAIALAIIVLSVDKNMGSVNIGTALLVLAALGWFGVAYLRWSTTQFVLTTDRLISRTGVFTRQGIEIPLERINTVFFRQTFFERLIRTGDLEIESASEEGSSEFSNIRRPLNVQNEIYYQMENNENRKFDRVGDRMTEAMQGGGAVAAGGANSIPDQIEKLDNLRRKGALTEAEFQAKKSELLKRL
jgi:uncharacterized membrane protein YdbT with pleckstrin-like domain